MLAPCAYTSVLLNLDNWVACWEQGGQLGTGWPVGNRVVSWVQGGQLGTGWPVGNRVASWKQGGLLGIGRLV